MSAPRIYVNAMCFGLRITGLRNLWDPTTEYQGKKQDKPTYLTGGIIPKTRGHWSEEPVFADVVRALQELYSKALSHIPFAQVAWPIKDGDVPEPGKTPAEWMRNHWYLPGSSTSPINTEIVQAGVPVKITNRAIVKPGDYGAMSVAFAVKTNDPRAVKTYCNSILFMNPGEEIAIGNSVTGRELMEKAQAQGMQITGFSAGGSMNVGGFGQQQPQGNQGGFGGGGFGQQQPQGNQGGFGQVQQGNQGGFGQGGFGGGQPQQQQQQQFNAPAPAQPQQNGFGQMQQQNPQGNQGGFGGGNFAPPNGGAFPQQGGFPGQGG